MRRHALVVVLSVFVLGGSLFAQVRDEQILRRAERGKVGVNPEEIVSFKSDMPFSKALASLSEMSKKFTGKIIVDPNPPAEDKPIGVNIESTPWRDALELILRTNGMWYSEQDQYFQVFSLTQGPAQAGAQQAAATPAGPGTPTPATGPLPAAAMVVDSAEIYAKGREVTISAVFLEIDKSKQNESGVNFSFFRGRDLNLGVNITGADRVGVGSGTSTFFSADVTPTSPRLTVDINAALKFFESTGIGEVIARPTVTVRSGNNGRVQVGESFSVKQRTISGDVTEQFFDAGTILQVSPKVWHYKNMDFIDLSVAVERSSLVDPVNVRLSKTQASSRLFLLDGEESYVGGLFLTEDKVNREGVPVLKDLPWWVFGLRYIFGYDQTISTKKELIVLLKANLVPLMEDRIDEVKKGQKNVLEQKLKEGREEMQKRSQKDKD